VDPTHCALCNSVEENNFHLFFTCPNSSNVWNMSELGTYITTMLNQGLDCSGTIFACVWWSIWKQRNNKVWNETVDAQCYVLERATSQLFEWELSQKNKLSLNNSSQTQLSWLVKWTKPSRWRMKCNIDPSFPNHEIGAFVLAKTEWYTPKCDVHVG
jgi:hypothetical protein